MTINVFDAMIPGSAITVVVDAVDAKSFKQLVNRACNLWPDAPASIKEFADKLTVGYIQQDYKSQNTDLVKKANQPLTTE